MITADMCDLLRFYEDKGWALVPARRGEKRPCIENWPHRQFRIGDIDLDGNVGVKLGRRSGNLVDVDLDAAEAIELAPLCMPPTAAIFGRKSNPNSHRLYTAAGAVFEAFTDPISGDTLLELRGDGAMGGCHQTIMPPSVAGGERREWCGQAIEPAIIDHRVLRRRCVRLAIACLTMRYVGEIPARRPEAPGWDHPRLLWEVDHELGRRAFQWLRQLAPDVPRRHPKRRTECSPLEIELAELARAIPNYCAREEWNRAGMAFFAASGGSEEGFLAFDTFSAKHPSYDPRETLARWQNYRRSPPTRIGVATLIYLARQAGWRREWRGQDVRAA